jgi:hypothetical protein
MFDYFYFTGLVLTNDKFSKKNIYYYSRFEFFIANQSFKQQKKIDRFRKLLTKHSIIGEKTHL